MEPLERQIDADLFDETILCTQSLILTVYPVVTDCTPKYLLRKGMEFCVLHAGSHVLEVVKIVIFRDKIWVEGLKQDATGKLRSDQLTQPGGSAAGGAGNQNAFAQVRAGIDVKNDFQFPAEHAYIIFWIEIVSSSNHPS